MPPKPSKIQPGTTQNPPKSKPGAAWGAKKMFHISQVTPKSAEESPKKRPRGIKSRPGAAKSQPSDAQELPQRDPDPSKTKPGEPEDQFLA